MSPTSEHDLLNLVDGLRIEQGYVDKILNIRSRIKEQLGNYIRDTPISSDTNAVLPHYVQGVRRQYLRARIAYACAKLDLAAAQRVSQQQNKHSTEDHTLTTYIDLSRLRQLIYHCQFLVKYIEKVEDTSSCPHPHNVLDRGAGTSSFSMRDNVVSTTEQAAAMTRKLENAVLYARYHLREGRRLLSSAEDRELFRSQSTHTSREALAAARAHLTAWIDHSLTQCDSHEMTEIPTSATNTSDGERLDASLEKQYREYVRARQNLLTVNKALQTQTGSLNDLAVPSIMSLGGNAHQPALPSLNPQLIGAALLASTAESRRDYIHDVALTLAHQRIEELRRLSDESHLLPAYPILMRRKARGHGNSGAGQQLMASLQDHDMASLLDSWKFAIDAAKIATTSAIDKNAEEGQAALDSVSSMIRGMCEHVQTWTQLHHA